MTVHDIWSGAAIIHAYSRADALADGTLVDASRRAAAVGFNVPVALSAAVYADCVTWTAADEATKPEGTGQDTTGRLHDVLMLAFLAAAAARGAVRDRVDFTLTRVPREGTGTSPRPVTLRMVIGPGDSPDPVITIMFPGDQ